MKTEKGIEMAPLTPGTVYVPCEGCGKTVKKWASQLKGRKFGAFCSNRCLGAYRSKVLVGEWAANYKTGSRRSREYIEVEAKWNPGANKKGYISLHRLIAEARMGRFLKENEIVHHKDHDQRNNHWDNLEVMTQSEHMKHHLHSKERKSDG